MMDKKAGVKITGFFINLHNVFLDGICCDRDRIGLRQMPDILVIFCNRTV